MGDAEERPPLGYWVQVGGRAALLARRATRQCGTLYMLASSYVLSQNYNMSMDEWLIRNHAELVQRLSLEWRASEGPEDWHPVGLSP